MKYTRIHWANTPDMERKRKIDCIENYNMLILEEIHLSEIKNKLKFQDRINKTRNGKQKK